GRNERQGQAERSGHRVVSQMFRRDAERSGARKNNEPQRHRDTKKRKTKKRVKKVLTPGPPGRRLQALPALALSSLCLCASVVRYSAALRCAPRRAETCAATCAA